MVVESIDFYDDEDDELPPPMSLKELLAFNKQQQMGAGGAGAEQDEAAAAAGDQEMGEVRGASEKVAGVFLFVFDSLPSASSRWAVCPSEEEPEAGVHKPRLGFRGVAV